MLFFQRILKEPAPAASTAPMVERRSARRFAISPAFALKAVLSFVPRDESGAPMSNTRQGWNWKGRLIDCSEEGVRMQLGPGLKLAPDEPCDLKLAVEGYELTIPCHVTNLTDQPEGVLLGLRHDIKDGENMSAYRQLLEIVALGATLKLHQPAAPDASGYLVEKYAGNRASRLTVWRHPADNSVAAFEFQLKDNLVRAAAGQRVEFLADTDGHGSRPASTEKCLEIGRLFTWVVPNLATVVPEDVREFLQRCAS